VNLYTQPLYLTNISRSLLRCRVAEPRFVSLPLGSNRSIDRDSDVPRVSRSVGSLQCKGSTARKAVPRHIEERDLVDIGDHLETHRGHSVEMYRLSVVPW
jgi:hypothetical protein